MGKPPTTFGISPMSQHLINGFPDDFPSTDYVEVDRILDIQEYKNFHHGSNCIFMVNELSDNDIEAVGSLAENNDQKDCFLYSAARNNALKLAKYLIDIGANVNKKFPPNNLTPLYYVAKGDYVDMANLLIENGARMNERNEYHLTPFHAAIFNICMLKLFVDNGANINEIFIRGTILDYAKQNADEEIIEYLISIGAKTKSELLHSINPEST